MPGWICVCPWSSKACTPPRSALQINPVVLGGGLASQHLAERALTVSLHGSVLAAGVLAGFLYGFLAGALGIAAHWSYCSAKPQLGTALCLCLGKAPASSFHRRVFCDGWPETPASTP